MDSVNSMLNSSEKLAPARQQIRENESAMPDAKVSYGLRTYAMSDLMSQEFPKPTWIVEGLIPEGITLMSAPPASFKTWLLLAIATSVATGSLLFNHFETEKTNVLMIDEENMASLLQHRLNLLGADHEIPVHFMFEQSFKLEAKQITRVIQFCEDNDIGLVTLDSLVRMHRASENDAIQMAEVFSNIRRFTKAGVNVLITHHNRKGSSENLAQEARGSSDIIAAVDCHISVKKDEGRRLVLTQTKLRIAEESDPVEIERISFGESLTFNYIGTMKPSESRKEKLISAILDVVDYRGDLNQKELQEQLLEAGVKTNIKTLRKTLIEMVREKLLGTTSGRGNETRYHIKNYAKDENEQ